MWIRRVERPIDQCGGDLMLAMNVIASRDAKRRAAVSAKEAMQ
jgi:hypothetical protein